MESNRRISNTFSSTCFLLKIAASSKKDQQEETKPEEEKEKEEEQGDKEKVETEIKLGGG
jgi:ribosomal protein L12E/L44/L45/RPP1/RPP2